MKLAGNLALSLPLKLCLNSADEEFVGVPTTTALLEISKLRIDCHPEGIPQGCLKDLDVHASYPPHLNRRFKFGGAV
jgi:hypothetical protein